MLTIACGGCYAAATITTLPWKFKSILKDAVMGYVSIQTVCLSCGLISIGHGLSFTCSGQVLKGLLVFGTAECITLPLELFSMIIWLV